LRNMARKNGSMTLMVSVMLVLASHADHSSSSSDGTMILNLTTKDFNAAVAETQHLLVEFCEYKLHVATSNE